MHLCDKRLTTGAEFPMCVVKPMSAPRGTKPLLVRTVMSPVLVLVGNRS